MPHRAASFVVCLTGALATACASLTAEQLVAVSKVQIVSSDPAENCQNLGTVSGSREADGPGGMRGKTVLMGGNTIRIDAKGVLSTAGTAFYCPAAKADPEADPTP
jgi:hypothetical protein